MCSLLLGCTSAQEGKNARESATDMPRDNSGTFGPEDASSPPQIDVRKTSADEAFRDAGLVQVAPEGKRAGGQTDASVPVNPDSASAPTPTTVFARDAEAPPTASDDSPVALSDAGPQTDPAVAPTAPVCDEDCSDGVPCTIDECTFGGCSNTPDHEVCDDGEYCDLDRGCVFGDGICATDDDCSSPTPCLAVRCDEASRLCVYRNLDGDRDGYIPRVCGGADCNDDSSSIHPDAMEVCDGLDNNCDGVVDPPAESSCLPTELCIERECECQPPNLQCSDAYALGGLVCADLMTDAEHCGACSNRCQVGGDCNAGACECPVGFTDCAGRCADLSADVRNCGGCDVSCGNGECDGGECVCPTNTVNCGDAGRWICRDLDTDPFGCGGCGNRCVTGAECDSGFCSAYLVDSVVFGRSWTDFDDPNFADYWLSSATDEDSYYFSAALEQGLSVMPGGEMSVLPAGHSLIRYDVGAGLVWSVPASKRLPQPLVGGGRVWVYVAVDEDGFTFGDQEYALGDGYGGAWLFFGLSTETGEVVETHRIDLSGISTSEPAVALDLDNELWALVWSGQEFRFDGLVLTTDTTTPGFLVNLSSGDSDILVSGGSLMVDPANNLIIGIRSGDSFTWGPNEFPDSTSARKVIGRLRTDFTHLNSFVADYSGRLTAFEDGLIESTNDGRVQFEWSGTGAVQTRELEIEGSAFAARDGILYAYAESTPGDNTLVRRYEFETLELIDAVEIAGRPGTVELGSGAVLVETVLVDESYPFGTSADDTMGLALSKLAYR